MRNFDGFSSLLVDHFENGAPLGVNWSCAYENTQRDTFKAHLKVFTNPSPWPWDRNRGQHDCIIPK